MITLQTLMNYSLSDIPDKLEREKSLTRQAFVQCPAQRHKPFKPPCSLDIRDNLFRGRHNIHNRSLFLAKTPKHYHVPHYGCNGDGLFS